MIFPPQTREKRVSRQILFDELRELSKGIPKCLLPHLYCIWLFSQSVHWLYFTSTCMQYNVAMRACACFSPPCSWVPMRWWNKLNFISTFYISSVNSLGPNLNGVVIILVVPSLLSWSWQLSAASCLNITDSLQSTRFSCFLLNWSQNISKKPEAFSLPLFNLNSASTRRDNQPQLVSKHS